MDKTLKDSTHILTRPDDFFVTVAPFGGEVHKFYLDTSKGQVPTVADAIEAANLEGVDEETGDEMAVDKIFINEDEKPKTLDTQLHNGDLIIVTINVIGG
jgi:hypothetical protein